MANHESSSIRLLEYKNILKKLKGLGFSKVFSSNLADTLGISASLVRKDFTQLTTSGNKKGGYIIDDLLGEINRLLNKGTETGAVIVGFGKLGKALCNYRGFIDENIRFVAAFDTDESKIDPDADVPVFPAEKLAEFVSTNKIKIAVLTIPGDVVQRTVDILVIAGVKGFLNFVPFRLVLPADCYENHINLAMELEKVILHITNGHKG
ncbi:MAG: redox-sensing transcriptional repressor Rex [Chitinivibrionales bacterium]|nr:redox-sensing transcriptional repressor Rex [Chitinivibrionales bacterium]